MGCHYEIGLYHSCVLHFLGGWGGGGVGGLKVEITTWVHKGMKSIRVFSLICHE